VSILVKVIISAGKNSVDIKDFILRFVEGNKSDREYVRSRLVGYFWGVSDMGGEIVAFKDGETFKLSKMVDVIIDEWEGGVEFEIN
jgi:hypothetical protein